MTCTLHKRVKINALRLIARRIGASPWWHWLVWNPIVRYGERMVYSHNNIQARIIPSIKGKDIDASGMISICGWGVLWGTAVFRNATGHINFMMPPKGSCRAFVPDWKFGRIRIAYHSLPENY